MRELRQRDPRQEDAKHLAFVRTQPCCICKKPGPSEAAHIRMNCDARNKQTGAGEKPHDMWTTPLCAYHHRLGPVAEHHLTERVFWPMFGRDPFEIALKLWQESGGAERAAMPKPVPRSRPIKARKPRGERAKIKSNSSFAAGHRPFGGYARPSQRCAPESDAQSLETREVQS
jgi:hypothetical protein